MAIIYSSGLFAFLITIAGLLLITRGRYLFKWKRILGDLQPAKICELRPGIFEVNGIVERRDRMLKTPFTLRDCVFYFYCIRFKPFLGRSWKNVRMHQESVPFILDDGAGKVFVDPEGARVDVPWNVNAQSGSVKGIPSEVARYLETNDVMQKPSLWRENMRFCESSVDVGSRVYVAGRFEAPSGGFDNGLSTYAIRKGDVPLYISNVSVKKKFARSRYARLYILMGVALALYGFYGLYIEISNVFI